MSDKKQNGAHFAAKPKRFWFFGSKKDVAVPTDQAVADAQASTADQVDEPTAEAQDAVTDALQPTASDAQSEAGTGVQSEPETTILEPEPETAEEPEAEANVAAVEGDAEADDASAATPQAEEQPEAEAAPQEEDELESILAAILKGADAAPEPPANEATVVSPAPQTAPIPTDAITDVLPAVQAPTQVVSHPAEEATEAVASLDNLPSAVGEDLHLDATEAAQDQTAVSPTVQTEPPVGLEGLTTLPASDISYEDEKPRHRGLKIALSLFALALVGGVYAGGVWAFKEQYFLPNTLINGEDVSLEKVADVADRHTRVTDGYAISVTGQGIELEISGDDIKLHSDGQAYVNDALSQVNAWYWPLELVTPHRLTADESITYDKAKLESLVENAVKAYNKKAKKPKDASYKYDESTHLYVVTPEVAGTTINAEPAVQLVTEAVDELKDSVELGEDLLQQPKVTSDDKTLNDQVNAVNTRLGAVQKLQIASRDVFEVGPDLIAGWLTIGDDLSSTLDREAVTTWARGPLSEKLDTVGMEHSYTRPDGKAVTVSGGTYGWTIDGAALASQICDNIEAGTAATIDVPMLQTAEVYKPGGQEWGNRYIDIDISEQHVRMYDASSNLIWESDCVTGNSSEGHDTPQGVYTLNNNKESGSVRLEGPDDEKTGEPEYVSYVTYWMPFIWNAVAMHDATWRYSFGGTIYQTDGSHGCVNLPYDKAEELYGICEVGDVVITHY